MSLFGNPSSSSNLSGTTATPGAASGAGASLFGGSSAPATSAAPGGLFGSAQASSTGATTGGSLFGAPPSNAATGGGLFGQAPASNTSATTGASVFGAPASNTAPKTSLFGQPASSAQPAPSLFGAAAKPAATGGLFGASSAAPATSAQAGSSLFGAAPASGAQAAAPTGSIQQQGQEGGNAQTAYFNSLLEKNKTRARDGENTGFGEVPSIQLGLGDISRRVRELGGVNNRGATGEQGSDSRAHYLLAASGVNPGTTLKDLNSFSATVGGTQARLPQDFEPDTYKYAGQLQQRTTQKMIQEGLERANRAFDAFVEEKTSIDWDAQRKKIYEHFGLVPRGADASTRIGGSFGRASRRAAENGHSGGGSLGRSIFSQSGIQKSVIGTPDRNAPLFSLNADQSNSNSKNADSGYLRQKQTSFAKAVARMNESRLRDSSHAVLHEFQEVEKQDGANAQTHMHSAYSALIEMVAEPPRPKDPTDSHRGPKARQFAGDYLDEQQGSAKSMAMRKRIIDGSRKSLEKQFYANALVVVDKNLREAKQGGEVGVIGKIKGFVRIRESRNELLLSEKVPLQKINEDENCWVIIFYLLRCGFVREAMQYVRDNQTSFRSIDRNFITYIGSYFSSEDRRLPRHQSERIATDYMSKLNYSQEDSIDPYRLACYKIVGRCQLAERTLVGVPSSVDDWIWLQFSLARESNRAEEGASEVFGLEELQATVKEIGQRHFGKNSDNTSGYSTYFYLQVLAGMFESATHYLYENAFVSAVHFAVALAYYGLLRVSDFTVSENELLTYTTREQPQISFGRMIGYYTRDFRTADATAATDYLSLICLNSDIAEPIGPQQKQLCHEAIRELVLETREFVTLLGDVKPQNGERIPGAVELRLPLLNLENTQDFLRNITLQAAAVADDAGRTSDAVLLFHLAEDYDNVIVIINRAISESLASEENFTDQGVPQPLPQQQNPKQEEEWSSMSLTAFENPIALGREIVRLYNDNPIYFQHIRNQNRDTLGLLLQVAHVRDCVLRRDWANAIEFATNLGLLPLNANSNISVVRSVANNVAGSPPVISRLVGPLMLWVLVAISQLRAQLLNGEGFETSDRELQKKLLAVMTKDLMIFVGLVRLRMPKAIWDELGVYNGEFGSEWGAA